jgi:hypothetical protein
MRQEDGEDCIMKSFHNLYVSQIIVIIIIIIIIIIIKSRSLRWAGHVARREEMRNAYRILIGRTERRRQLLTPRHIWEDNIKMDVTETKLIFEDWIPLPQDRNYWWAVVNMVMNIRVS